MARFRCLYTRDARKKRRVYHDGFIRFIHPGAPPVLTDEAGAVLATAERGVAALDAHADGLTLWDGFLVDVDGVEGEDEAAPTTLPPAAPRPGLVGAAKGGSVPRVLRPSRPGAPGRRAAAFLAPPAVAACPRTEDGAAASTAPPSAARTDDEILGLLAGRPPKQTPRRASAPAEPAGAWRPPRVDTTARQPLAPARQPAATLTHWTDRRKRAADDDGDDDGRRGTDATSQLSTSLRFPDAAAAAAPPVRAVALPTTFPNAGAYTTLLGDAVVDELQIRLHLCARAFRSAVASLPPRSPPPAVERAARRAVAEFYGSADLQASAGPSRVHADRGPPPGGGALFLTLHSGRLASSAYRQGDLWVIASDAALAGLAPGAVGDRTAGSWVTIARARWHGPSADGRLAVALVTPRPPALRRSQPVCALRVGEAGTDLACLAALRGGGAGRVPALPALLGAPLAAPPPATGRAAADAAAHAAAARLNDDQAAVIDRLAAWVAAPAPRPPATVLVHGPFGCGKSALLVAATAFLARKLDDDAPTTTTLPPGCGLRVLVVSHTNAAVDRVLVGLLDAGFDDVLRVGPVRKIHARLLPHSLSSPTAKAADVVADLTAMVRDAPSRAAAAAAAAELQRVKAGALTRRRAALARAAVVGATAVSAGGLPHDTPPFDVAVVDEASQLTEPLALLALAAARPACVIVAGDPKQLPPVVSGPAAPAPRPGAPRPAGLARSLLARLIDAGNAALLLRTQYRCHPAIAALANAAFYGGALRDGVSADARAALLPGLPPVAFVPVPGGVAHAGDGGRSPSNEAEAHAVVRCVRELRGAGIDADRVGVICFYRAQAALVARLLAQGEQSGDDDADASTTTTVATVDSFQGAEKDVIILTTVVTRASPFAGDAARLCVSLTRGRHHLVVVGHPGALTEDAVLGRVVGGAGVWRP